MVSAICFEFSLGYILQNIFSSLCTIIVLHSLTCAAV